jgi:hypothetical protein
MHSQKPLMTTSTAVLVAEFKGVETGKSADALDKRPQLREALRVSVSCASFVDRPHVFHNACVLKIGHAIPYIARSRR